ncbi:hypothetical protein GCM10017783_05650 [Deinococcus piscis]|uniref:Uncharacterized protein n=1 Tax=Deinococcus piscis TaxID=394230 RepID=A0ABQ3K1M7_9DEIO|nr:hypothetical protein [Deinococcus piscis]GHF96645.1 hypothetical protein GCM10017783_05650 [Deinococcus piscis]
MTRETTASSTRPVPPQLKWLTLPLLIELVSNAIALLTLPFAQDTLIAQLQTTLPQLGIENLELTPALLQSTLWTTFFILMALTLLLYFVREGVKDGRGWAWVMCILIGVFSLLNLPLGPFIGLALLYGAFQPAVRAYFGR